MPVVCRVTNRRRKDVHHDRDRDRHSGPSSVPARDGLVALELLIMTRLICDISVSLDAFVAGPNQTLEQPLGEGGEKLHEWAFGLASWRERHGLEGGETNA